jgi:ABC-type nickel/cobalt efflux system permease component RcnA
VALHRRSFGVVRVVKKVVRLGISVCLLYGFWMLMNWKLLWVVLGPLGLTRREAGFWLMLGAILIWWVSVLWIVFSRPRRRQGVVAANPARSVVHQDVLSTADEVHSNTLHQAAPKPLACRKGRNAGPQRDAPARNRRNRRDTDRTNHRYLN